MSHSHEKKFTATIARLSHEGRGVCQHNGKVQFIDNALPGETVTVQVLHTHGRFDEGVAVEVENPSIDRAIPPCDYVSICGGCSLQHIKPEAQISFKEAQLKEQLEHFGGCSAKEYLPPLQAETEGYRRKARLGVKYVAKKNKVLVGFREKNGRYLADLASCKVLHPLFGHLLDPLSHLIGQLSNYQNIPQIECAMGDTEAAIIIRHLTPFVAIDLKRLEQFGEKHGVQIFLQSQGVNSVTKLWPHDKEVFLHYALPTYDINFHFYPTDFTQVNLEINRQMVDQALRLLELSSKDVILDLFCGIGNFSLPIACTAKKVLGVEGDPMMVERAKDNAKKNYVRNADFIAADLTKEFSFAQKLHANKVLLDPPRSGAFEVLPHVVALKPERIVYVSCNPATLARDTQYLVSQGYTLEKAGVMDMFPHTQHVESMALFVRA